jgi:hypothetical protein
MTAEACPCRAFGGQFAALAGATILNMESKTARLTVLIDPDKKEAFETLCARQDQTASQVVRQLIRDYLAKHGVPYGKDVVARG